MVPVSEPPKKVVLAFEPGKRSCQYLMITLKVVPLYDVNPYSNVEVAKQVIGNDVWVNESARRKNSHSHGL